MRKTPVLRRPHVVSLKMSDTNASRERSRERTPVLSDETREARLRRRRECSRERRAAETSVQREARLARRREKDRARRTHYIVE